MGRGGEGFPARVLTPACRRLPSDHVPTRLLLCLRALLPCLRAALLPCGPACRGFTLAAPHRSDTVPGTTDQRVNLILDNLTTLPSWGVTTALAFGLAITGGPHWMYSPGAGAWGGSRESAPKIS